MGPPVVRGVSLRLQLHVIWTGTRDLDWQLSIPHDSPHGSHAHGTWCASYLTWGNCAGGVCRSVTSESGTACDVAGSAAVASRILILYHTPSGFIRNRNTVVACPCGMACRNEHTEY